jgi:hypothetical protein
VAARRDRQHPLTGTRATCCGQAAELVLARVAGGEVADQDAATFRSQAFGDLEALHVGEHHVEHHQLGTERLHLRERLLARAGDLDLESQVTQGHRDDVGVRLVLDDEHLLRDGRGCRHRTRSPAQAERTREDLERGRDGATQPGR